MTGVLVACAALGVAAALSGWFVWQQGRSRASAAALMAGGSILLLGSGAAAVDLEAMAAPSFRLAGCLLLPFAVLAYPRLGWRDPMSFVLAVLLAGAGSLSVVWRAALDPMAYLIVGA